MDQHKDANALFEAVSPKHYREFRRLYNELLGYFEREEFDKIETFSKRLEGMIGHAFYVQLVLQKRLKDYQKQRGVVIKSTLHQRFRNPKSTIPITHPFPLSSAFQSKLDDVPEPVPNVVESSLELDRKVDALMEDMAEYDQQVSQSSMEDDEIRLKTAKHSVQLDAATPGAQGHSIVGDVVMKDDDIDDSGVSLRDDLKDESLYFREKGRDQDVQRASETLRSSKSQDLSETSNPSVANSPSDSSKTRKERIWDYINKDKSSGGVDYDL